MAFRVEHRGEAYFVVDRDRGWELAPVFHNLTTAAEIAEKANAGTPFFDNIPVCQLDSPAAERIGARPLTPAERGLA